MNKKSIYLTECPRDAMQGIAEWIPTSLKIEYLKSLLQVRFSCIDFGSFVSPKAIPQMADTHDVIEAIEHIESKSKLLAIVANMRGATEALQYQKIDYIGFPLSVSETFQQRNTHMSISKALEVVKGIQNLCEESTKKMVVYLSMCFGNPYKEAIDDNMILNLSNQLSDLGVSVIVPSDTIGAATAMDIEKMGKLLLNNLAHIEWGLHLHSNPSNSFDKIEAALHSGFHRIDAALKGFGGCPMASDSLTGNIATEQLLLYCDSKQIDTGIDKQHLAQALALADKIFGRYH
jgi:hydroxymethylglutaryl-CoA lyase